MVAKTIISSVTSGDEVWAGARSEIFIHTVVAGAHPKQTATRVSSLVTRRCWTVWCCLWMFLMCSTLARAEYLELAHDEHPPWSHSQTRGGKLMGLYITPHDDMVMGDQAAVCKSKAILKIETEDTKKHRDWTWWQQQVNVNACCQSCSTMIFESRFRMEVNEPPVDKASAPAVVSVAQRGR